jgi:hypothetical protein
MARGQKKTDDASTAHTRPGISFDSHNKKAKSELKAASRRLKLSSLNGAPAKKKVRVVKPLNASLLEYVRSGPPPPPCPANNLPPKVRAKAASRQLKCAAPGVKAASSALPIPLIWSRELIESRKVFRNENPFEVSKFNFFKSQLPPTSNLSGLIGSTSLGCAECDTCAVVGASGSLLNRRHGPLIDAHQVVLRPNWLLIKGYEHLVGTRTDLNLFFGVEGMIDQFDVTQGKLPPQQRAIGLVTPASDRSVASFFRHMSRVHKNRTRSCRGSCTTVTLLTDDVYHRALGTLCAATDGGCTWAKSTSRMRPSTGFFSVILALQMCRKVSLFGLTTDPCKPFHYYGEPKPSCTEKIPPKYDESVHWFEKEHAIYRDLETKGALTIYS